MKIGVFDATGIRPGWLVRVPYRRATAGIVLAISVLLGAAWTSYLYGRLDCSCAAARSLPLAVALGGMPIALLVFVGAASIVGRRGHAAAAARKPAVEAAAGEERFRQAFSHAPFGMVISDMDGRMAQVNPAQCRMLGYAESELVGMAGRDVSREDEAEIDAALTRSLVDGEMEVYSVEELSRHKDGHWVPVLKRTSLVRDDAGRPLYMISQFQDLSERCNREYEALAIKTLELIEQERTRLSRELHDEVGQTLAALTLSLDRVDRVCGHGGAASSIGQAREITAQLVTTVRDLAHRLRPSQLDQLGLVAALRWHIDKVIRPLGIEINFAQNIGDLRLPTEFESCLFRVAQESLTNVTRHARATAVTVALFLHRDRLTLLVGDDGVGFDMAGYDRRAGRGTLGLLGMRERVAALDGQFEIRSNPTEGTEIRASFILPQV